MQLYPAIVAPANGGGYYAAFIGLPGVLTQGASFHEAVASAQDALNGAIGSFWESGKTPPPPPSDTDVQGQAMPEGGRVIYLVGPEADKPPVPVTFTIGPGLLARIDRARKAENMSRSAFLANGARMLLAELARMDED